MYVCCTQVFTHAFTVKKGITSILKHIERLHCSYDYFSFLNNPLKSLLKCYYVMQKAQNHPRTDT